jgi:hypothetical protein
MAALANEVDFIHREGIDVYRSEAGGDSLDNRAGL